MNAPPQSPIDLSAEAAGAPYELFLIAIVALAAFAYLLRGFLLKRKRMASGQGCGQCSGCGSTSSCALTELANAPEDERKA